MALKRLCQRDCGGLVVPGWTQLQSLNWTLVCNRDDINAVQLRLIERHRILRFVSRDASFAWLFSVLSVRGGGAEHNVGGDCRVPASAARGRRRDADADTELDRAVQSIQINAIQLPAVERHRFLCFRANGYLFGVDIPHSFGSGGWF